MAEPLNLLSKLQTTANTSSSSYKFPRDLFDGSTDYVRFKFYQYKGPFAGNQNTADTVDKDGKATKAAVTDLTSYNQANAEYAPYPDDGVKDVYFYMPEDISTGYQYSWGGKEFSNIGVNALRGGGSLLAGDAGGFAGAVGQLIKNAVGALPTAGAEAIANGINATGAGNVTTNDVLGGSLGVVLNPNTELIFDGFKLRSFSMRFKMAPRNKEEAKEMRKIIGCFKKVAAPVFGPGAGGALDIAGGFKKLFGEEDKAEEQTASTTEATDKSKLLADSNANYIGVPGLVQPIFMKGAKIHPYLPQYKVCAISDVSVNYTPDGVYATYYDDGAPVAVELSITFSETKLIYSQEFVIDGASY